MDSFVRTAQTLLIATFVCVALYFLWPIILGAAIFCVLCIIFLFVAALIMD